MTNSSHTGATLKSNLPSTQSELETACRIAKSRNGGPNPIVFSKKEPMEAFQAGGEYKCYFTMMGCTVVEEGKYDEAEKEMNLTMEQVNFPVIA